ncbi:phage baseplate assembly protein V [Erwinia persicina]|uniref:phage baseplate assembly protein V n=1 Tax=Erwinia persicina TaxID=55211 RepID=UPI00177C0F7D|nr:phage baseplate assembly protein V [Erwinia persicina]MBD8170106.1 hypothetical protein [Erwinia persicina]
MKDIALKIAGTTCSLAVSQLRILQQINAVPVAHVDLQVPVDNNDASDVQSQGLAGQIAVGSSVEITLDKVVLFSGYLVRKSVLMRGKQWTLRLDVRHLLQKLTFYPCSRIFRQQDDSTMMHALLQDAGVKMNRKTTAQLSTRHDQMVQFRVSNWQFILSRLFATNCWLIPDVTSNGVTIAPLAQPAVASNKIERYADGSGYTLYDVELTFDNRFTPDTLSLQGWDIAQQQLTTAQKSGTQSFQPWKASATAVASSGKQQDYQLAFSCLPDTMLSTLSQSWINHQQMTAVQGRLLLEGTRDFQPGESITLSQFGAGLDGSAVLTGVNQQFNLAEGWRTELLLGMSGTLPEPVPSIQSLQIATVADFTADPQDLDRIPISLPALNLPGEYIFARLGKPWASKASGFCFYPETGDEVVVGFIENDPRYPVILDSLHNPKNTAPFSPDRKNNLKGLVVSKDDYTGQLMMNTEEKTVTLSAGKASFSLTADKSMQLNTPETMTFSASAVSYQVSDTLSLSADSQMVLTSSSINMKQK